MKLLDLLSAPDREFTPTPFWFLNGDLDHEEIRRQMKDFYDHGVYGVVLHPRMGLPERIGYLSSEFFDYIRTAVQLAAELDMRIVLYDEGMYPSGSANGQVVQGHPEFVSQGLALVDGVRQGDEVLAQVGEKVLVVRPSGGTIRGIHFGEDDGEPNAPASADILNPDVVARFIELTHEAYYREFGEYFGSTIIGFFTDEPDILGRNVRGMFPWTKGLGKLFTATGGDLAGLSALFEGTENDHTRLYRQMILNREGDVYYGALSRWCEAHGIALMGHPSQSDDIELERYFHIPGQDLILRRVAPELGGITGAESTMAKCGSDAARLMGRRRNANECFGACNKDGNPWQFSGGDMKWYLDWMAVRGVNLFIPHAFYYSIEGSRRDERPPDVGPNNIWWSHYRQWAAYMARLSCLMTDAELHAEAAVLCQNRDLHPELASPLFQRQIGFQYIPESAWKDCYEENGTLICAGHRFTAVLGDEDVFPTVPHPSVEELTPDCTCVPAQPELRVARFTRAGNECWLLVNEGNSAISARLTLPTYSPVGQYDLWKGTACQATAWMHLSLPARGSVMFFTCTVEEWNRLPDSPEVCSIPCPTFTMMNHDPARVRKEYTAQLIISSAELSRPSAILELEAEEMAELWVNGVFVGAGFWRPQRFDLKPYIREGKNTLHLVVTGSLANLYGRSPVWYGLKEAENHV